VNSLLFVALCVLAIMFVLHMGIGLKEAMAKHERRKQAHSERCQVCRQMVSINAATRQHVIWCCPCGATAYYQPWEEIKRSFNSAAPGSLITRTHLSHCRQTKERKLRTCALLLQGKGGLHDR